ncbi:MAG: preprotein translocase subunit SecE [Acidimicrobiia bacterium]|jgi:preprotein translocase subunit SecE|nr:preprotein translocase subunit SecE [Acidimicrobiia bacterium]
MAMNREQKRLLQRQGYIAEDGEVVQGRRERTQQAVRPDRQRTRPGQFVKETRAELRKVAWPSRQQVVHYSLVVLVFLVVVTTIVALVDWGFAKAVLWLFGVK